MSNPSPQRKAKMKERKLKPQTKTSQPTNQPKQEASKKRQSPTLVRSTESMGHKSSTDPAELFLSHPFSSKDVHEALLPPVGPSAVR